MIRNDDSPTPRGTIGREIVAWTDYQSVTLAVVDAVAGATNCDPYQVSALEDSVDVDALEAIFADDVDEWTVVSFNHADARIVISGDGTVVARPRLL